MNLKEQLNEVAQTNHANDYQKKVKIVEVKDDLASKVTDVKEVFNQLKEELPADLFNGATFVFCNSNVSIAPREFTVDTYNGDRYIESRLQEKELAAMQDYTREELYLMLMLGKPQLMEKCRAMMEVVHEPIDLALLAITLVEIGNLPHEWLNKEVYLQRLLDTCKLRHMRGMSVDNIRAHVNRILEEKRNQKALRKAEKE